MSVLPKVTVAVVGDKGVGKTSLITTAATEHFSDRPPPVVPPTKFPPDFHSEPVDLTVHDTSSKPEDHLQVELTIKHSDVVVIAFDSTRRDTVARLRSVWLPEIQRLKPEVPVIIVCCKADVDTSREVEELRESLEPLLQDFPQLEVVLKCSARALHKVQDVFYYAVKVVLYPMGPLYDKVMHTLQPACVKALLRIFSMCDQDGDGVLSDAELNDFQIFCFNTPLSDEELHSVKDVVRSKMPSGINERGMLFGGFIYLHSLFITRGRLESTWVVMRKFGYNEQLRIADEVLDRVNLHAPHDQVMELSDTALQYLSAQYDAYDQYREDQLTLADIDKMFATSPTPIFQTEMWNRVQVPCAPSGNMTKEGFLVKWKYCAAQDPRGALEQIMYMGFDGPQGRSPSELFERRSRRRLDKKRRELAHRSSLNCYVFGARGSGKSTLIKALAGQRHQDPQHGDYAVAGANVPTTATAAAAGGAAQSTTLLMTEITSEAATEMLSTAAGRSSIAGATAGARHGEAVGKWDLSKCDVAAFVYDASSAQSLQAAIALLTTVSTAAGDTLPCVLVAAKEDLGLSPEVKAQVHTVCAELCIPTSVGTSLPSGEPADATASTADFTPLLLPVDTPEPAESTGAAPSGARPLQPTAPAGGSNVSVYARIVDAALRPEAHIPDTPARKTRRLVVRRTLLYSGVAVTTALTLYVGWRVYKHYSQADNSSSSSGGGGSADRRLLADSHRPSYQSSLPAHR